ncbi:MAG: sulfatase-like hydrolase/transferase [Gammaproteobacteria bacterium]
MAKTRTLIFLLSTLLWTSVVSARNPNIVFILVDDMGYGDLSSYNAESKIPTPNLDSLAQGGIRFTDAHSAGPLCHPSRYGLMTGQLPFRIDYGVWREHALISSDRMTVASFLRGQGYHTAMVGKWHLGFEENGYENPLPAGLWMWDSTLFSGSEPRRISRPTFTLTGTGRSWHLSTTLKPTTATAGRASREPFGEQVALPQIFG